MVILSQANHIVRSLDIFSGKTEKALWPHETDKGIGELKIGECAVLPL